MIRKVIAQCDKCGVEKEIIHNLHSYGGNSVGGMWSVNLGRAGYDSELDGCDITFNLCDKCLVKFINTFKNKEDIFNSGSNVADTFRWV